MTARHRVVIVGGGVGGLAAAKALRGAQDERRETSDDETFAGAARAIAMGDR